MTELLQYAEFYIYGQMNVGADTQTVRIAGGIQGKWSEAWLQVVSSPGGVGQLRWQWPVNCLAFCTDQAQKLIAPEMRAVAP